jgi:hypothetical protein
MELYCSEDFRAFIALKPEQVKLYKQILKEPKRFETMLTKPMKDTKYRFLIIPGERIPKNARLRGNYALEEERTLEDYISHTLKYRDELTRYFIIDEKSKNIVGFVAYFVDKEKSIVGGIKLVRFDEDGEVKDDVDNLLNDLVSKYRDVKWTAILHKDNRVIEPYNIYLKKKKDDGYVAEYREVSRYNQELAIYRIRWD